MRRADPTHHEEVTMAKKSRKKKARKKNAANHGKRPNS
ncbi:50S ribosomal protein bL37 [Micromonospora sp. 067-2]